MLPKNPTKSDFEKIYEETDPWQIKKNIVTEVIVTTLKKYFSNLNFKSGLDIGCGEGFITSRLDFVNEWSGIDISERAINRAATNYPNIKFEVMDLNSLFREQDKQNKFDLIVCLETLYYLPDDQQRKFLQNLKKLGKNETIYCISLVVSGPSIFRHHPTYTEAIDNLSEFFLIEKILPISVKDLPLSRANFWILKLEKLLPLTLYRKRLYLKHLERIDLEDSHQVIFVLHSL